jgi:hypothetical protein
MSNLHAAAVLGSLAAVCIASAAGAASGTFYVSPTGSDANPGTFAAPWRTIQKAASTVGAGSTVNIRAGVYREKVDVQVSGSAAGGYITFRSNPGETAILDGTGQGSFSADGFPVGLFQIKDHNYIVVSGLEIRNFIGRNSSTFPAGLYVGDTADHIRIVNNRIHHIRGSLNGLFDGHGLAVYGTAAPGSINNILIDGNEVYDLKLGQSESVVVNGNVEFWTISNNYIHDSDNIGIDAIGFEGKSPDPVLDQARDGLIATNTVVNINDNNNPAYPPMDNSANGIYVDGGTRIVIERNIVQKANVGIETASEHLGKLTSFVTTRNNLVYESTGPGASLGGYGVKRGSSDHCVFVNNTFWHNDSLQTGSGELQVQFFPQDGTATGNLFANNIVVANNQGYLVIDHRGLSPPSLTLDYNLYQAPNGTEFWQWNGSNYHSFAAYQTGSRDDGHGVFADPSFVDTATGDFRLQAGSPALNVGKNYGSTVVGNVDLAGNPRVVGGLIDIGAYEH